MTQEHEIKIDTRYYNRVQTGEKTFEIRKDDRDYQVGDKLLMREHIEGEGDVNYSSPIHAIITYKSTFQQKEGWCVLGIKLEEPECPVNQ